MLEGTPQYGVNHLKLSSTGVNCIQYFILALKQYNHTTWSN